MISTLVALIALLLAAPVTVSGLSASTAQTPRLLKPGTTVTIRGSGFHAGARVRFGNDDAVVNASAIAANGASLTAVVPAQATSGKVSVQQDGAWHDAPAPLAIDNWRNVNGYAFVNSDKFQSMVGNWSFADLTEVFGFDQTHLNVFGWRPDDPLAHAFLGIANSTLHSGQCFGFTVSSLRFQGGQKPLGQFASWNGSDPNASGPTRDVWHLKGPQLGNGTNASPALAHFVHLTHIQQYSAEFLSAWIGHWNLLAHADTLRSQVKAALATGHAGIFTFNGNGLNHVTQVYNLEEHADGSFNVLLYDPNIPFVAGEADGSRTRLSTVMVDKSGHYSDAGHNIKGTVRDLRAMPWTAAPATPHLPTIQGALSAISHLFGDAAQVTQITDAAGKTMFAADGSPNYDASTRMPGSGPFVPFDSKPGARPIFILGGKGPFRHTVTGKAAGKYSLQFVGDGFSAQLLDAPSAPGHRDELTVDHGGAGLHFKTSAANKEVRLSLLARAADKSVRTAVLTTTGAANQELHLAFDAAREQLVYRHTGAAASVKLELMAHGPDQKMQTLVSPAAKLEHGDVLTIKPDWKSLQSSAPGQLKKADGRVMPHPIRGAQPR